MYIYINIYNIYYILFGSYPFPSYIWHITTVYSLQVNLDLHWLTATAVLRRLL